ncbi:MAG: hypothetical protein M3O03_11580 [Pseudomonadota bacterium]|nr:hypothetical protein [Pseudomonadota bacterium]
MSFDRTEDELLDALIIARREIEQQSTAKFTAGNLPELCSIVIEMLGYSNTGYIDNPWGVAPSLINKFVKGSGQVTKAQAYMLADRLQSYMRTSQTATTGAFNTGAFGQDAFGSSPFGGGPIAGGPIGAGNVLPSNNLTAGTTPTIARSSASIDHSSARIDEAVSATAVLSGDVLTASAVTSGNKQDHQVSVTKVIVRAEAWVFVPKNNETKQKIKLISELLDDIVLQVRSSNLPPSEQLLTDIEKAELIAILQTALNILKSPMVESGLLKTLEGTLKELGIKAAREKIQQGLGIGMQTGAHAIWELLKSYLQN